MSSLEQKLEKLCAAGIEIVSSAGMSRHFLLSRDGFVALVERRGDSFGAIGAAGKATEEGFAALMWRDGQPRFVTRGYDQPATSEDVERLRAFERSLGEALH